MMISYIIPTRNRPERLRHTLARIGELDGTAHVVGGGAEVIVVDNASDPVKRAKLPMMLANGLPVRTAGLESNLGAAGRNTGAQMASGEWLIMLDDDSHPLDAAHIELLREAPHDLAAIGAEVFLPDGSRERGGLPEVFIGCGAAIRRPAFLDAGGYDATFEYYAEEYDLCAKLLLQGWRIAHDCTGRFRVLHEKTTLGRDFNTIANRLVRNNAWVMQRYAPEAMRHAEILHIIERYAGIALHERAASGFAAGLADLNHTLADQPRTPMSQELFDRFTGLAAVRRQLDNLDLPPGLRIGLVDPGKNAHVIRLALAQRRHVVVDVEREADLLMIGTLSPGPMRDALGRHAGDRRVVAACVTGVGQIRRLTPAAI